MAIGRPQMEEQIKGFADAGAVEKTDPFSGPIDLGSIDPNTLRLMMLKQMQPDFETSYQKYQQRLAPYAAQQPRTSIYDVASQLGAAILESPRSGNVYEGIGRGFANVAQKIKQDQMRFDKERKEIGMMAMQLAMQDEQRAQKFLDDMAVKLIGDTNSDVKTKFISYVDPTTNKRVERLFDTSSEEFKKIIADPEKFKAQNVHEPLMGGPNQYEALDKNTADAITDQEKIWQEESNAQYGVLDKLDAAENYAAQLREEDFGNFEVVFGVPIKNIMTSVGFGNLIDQERLGAQIAVNSVGTGLAMGLISQTKGAISDREMAMFLAASATLGNNKNGFLKILSLTRKIANKAVGYNTAWLRERERLQGEGASLSAIRAAQTEFQAKYHAENPLFAGSKDANGNDIYNPELSIEDNLKNLEEGSEAYEIVAAMTPEGVAEYNLLSGRHKNISLQNTVDKQKTADKQTPSQTANVDEKAQITAKQIVEDKNLDRATKKQYLQDMLDGGLPVDEFIIQAYELTRPE